jgi:cytidylate kinase
MAILTLSREFGCDLKIGRSVAAMMGYQYIDREIILEDLRKIGSKWEDWAKELDEHCPTIWEKNDWSFRGFTALIQSEILQYALLDRVVIMGRGSNFLLEGIGSAYRVRLVAPIEYRIARIMEREDLDYSTAQWLLKKTDSERLCFISSIYDKQIHDPAGYDAIYEVDTTTTDVIVQSIIAILKEKEAENTPEVKDILRMRAAAARVKAGIATNPTLFVPVLEVSVIGVSLVIRGVTHTAKEQKRLKEMAVKLAGDIPIQFELHFRV